METFCEVIKMKFGWMTNNNLVRIGQILVTLCDTCGKPLRNRYKDNLPHNCSRCNNWISLNDLKAKRLFK